MAMKMPAPAHTLEEFDVEMSGGIRYCEVIHPVFETACAIALVSSDEYAPFAAVTVASILANADPNHAYDIVVLTNDMLQRNRWRIESLAAEMENASVRVLDISQMIEGFSFYTWAHFTSNTYYRLLTPDVFERYEKVIYVDSDVVVNHDIAELFLVDLTGYYLAAAYDTHVVSYCTQDPPLEQREYNIKTLGMEKPEQYFQAGVSLFNITALHRDFEPGYLIRQGMENQLRWLDQDVLNKLFYGKILRLPNRWNVMVNNLPDNLDEYYLPDELREEYYEARRAPYMVHYVGRAMPCYTTKPDLFEYFWKYARLTPFYEILIQRMAIDYAEKLAQSVRIQLRQELHRETFSEKWRRRIWSFTNRVLPQGSKRRFCVKKLLSVFRKKN
ncbi:MAG: glycosyltransferase family 8 protein [Provencibacterium sp.]|jgi:lipopolysaccharide biosynthesis glycosyltransferase|nr:glycosyltransferase family 8 protein [Provencibacterium sp.]